MAELVDALVIKTETRIWFGSSVVEQVWLTPDFVTGGFDSTPDRQTVPRCLPSDQHTSRGLVSEQGNSPRHNLYRTLGKVLLQEGHPSRVF